MKLNNIISEAIGVNNIQKEEYFWILKHKCKNNYKFMKDNYKQGNIQTFLWRGFGNDQTMMEMGKYSTVDPSQRIRQSKNTSNYYTLLLSNLPEWQKYPKRDRSLICSTSGKKAGAYGVRFAVIPYDEVKLGVCPESDIWDSFEELKQEGFSTLEDFNDYFELLFSLKKPNTYQEIVERVKNFSLPLKLSDVNNIHWIPMFLQNFFIQLSKKKMSYLQELLSPDNNDFHLSSFEDLPFSKNRECWFSGECVCVHFVDFEDIFGR